MNLYTWLCLWMTVRLMVQPGDFWTSRSLFGLWVSTMHHCTRWRHQTVSQEKLLSRWLVSITHLDPKLSRSVYNASVQPKQLFPLKWYHTTILVHCLVHFFWRSVNASLNYKIWWYKFLQGHGYNSQDPGQGWAAHHLLIIRFKTVWSTFYSPKIFMRTNNILILYII